MLNCYYTGSKSVPVSQFSKQLLNITSQIQGKAKNVQGTQMNRILHNRYFKIVNIYNDFS